MTPTTEPRFVLVPEIDDESEGSTPPDSSEEEHEPRWQQDMSRDSDMPAEYWNIQKLIKYMKVPY